MAGQGGERNGRVLIAGVGNIFLSDDGFGTYVAQRLSAMNLPEGVRVADYGISGMHLAYDIAEGYDTAIVIDAAPSGGEPGSIVVTEVGTQHPQDRAAGAEPTMRLFDAHGMQPHVVFKTLDMLGARPGRIIVVGCQPYSTGYGIGLSEPVEAAVGQAVRVVTDLLAAAGPTPTAPSKRGPAPPPSRGPAPPPSLGPAPPPTSQCGHDQACGGQPATSDPGQPSHGQLP